MEKKRAGISIKYNMPDGRRVRGDLIEGAERVLSLLCAEDLALVSDNASLSKWHEAAPNEAGQSIAGKNPLYRTVNM